MNQLTSLNSDQTRFVNRTDFTLLDPLITDDKIDDAKELFRLGLDSGFENFCLGQEYFGIVVDPVIREYSQNSSSLISFLNFSTVMFFPGGMHYLGLDDEEFNAPREIKHITEKLQDKYNIDLNEIDIMLPTASYRLWKNFDLDKYIVNISYLCNFNSIKVIVESTARDDAQNLKILDALADIGGKTYSHIMFKTGSGKSGPFDMEQVHMLSNHIEENCEDGSIGIKVSGGIRNSEQVRELLNIKHVKRLGISGRNAISILRELDDGA